MPYVFAGLIGLASLVVALLMAVRRLKETEATVEKANTRRLAQVERIKKAARTTLNLAREKEAMRRRKNAIEIACEDLEGRLAASKALDKRLYVLDDRRTQADLGWIVRVVNADYAYKVNAKIDRTALETWRRGRRFIVWALDEKKAREKVIARFQEHKGFDIVSVEKQQS